MKTVLLALLALAQTQGQDQKTLQITPTTPPELLIQMFKNKSGLPVDDSALKPRYAEISVRFSDDEIRNRTIGAPSWEKLLERIALICEPKVEVTRRGANYVLRISGDVEVKAFVRVNLASDISIQDAMTEFKSRYSAQGITLEEQPRDWWVKYHAPNTKNRDDRWNKVDGDIEAGSLDEAFALLLSKSSPTIRAVRDGNRIRLEHKYPFVNLDTFQKDSTLSKSLKEILDEINKQLPGYKLQDQSYKPAIKIKQQFSITEWPLDWALRAIADACEPRLEVLDLDPDRKTGRLVLEATSGKPLIVPQAGHRGGIVAVEADLQGNRVVSEGSEGTISVWDVARRKTVNSYVGKVARNGFSTDGGTVIVASGGDISRIDFVNKRVNWLRGTGGNVTSFAYSPQRRIIAATSADGSIYVFNETDPRTKGRGYRFFSNADIRAGDKRVALSPDGKVLACYFGNQILMWQIPNSNGGIVDFAMMDAKATPFAMPGTVQQVEFSPDGKTLAVSCDPGIVALFEYGVNTLSPKSLSSVNTTPTHYLYSNQDVGNSQRIPIRFSPDGLTFAVMLGENQVSMYDPSTGALTSRVDRSGNQGSWAFGDVAWLGDGRMVGGLNVTANTSVSDKIAIYKTGQSPETFQGSTTPIRNVWFSTDGRSLVVDEQGTGFRRWDLTMRTPPTFYAAESVSVQPFNYRDANESKQGMMLMGIVHDYPPPARGMIGQPVGKRVKVPLLKRWIVLPNTVSEYVYSPDLFPITPNVNQIVWSGDGSRFALVEQRSVRVATPHTPPTPPILMPATIQSIKLSSTGRYLAAYCEDQARGYFVLYDLGERENAMEVTERFNTPIPGRSGNRIIAADQLKDRIAFSDGTSTFVFVRYEKGSNAYGPIKGVNPSLSADGRFIAVQDGDTCVRYDLGAIENGGSAREWGRSKRGQFQPILAPSGQEMLTRSQDQTKAYYYNFQTSVSPAELFQHRSPIVGISFAPNQSMVALGSDDGTVWIYGPKATEDPFIKIAWPTSGNPLVQLRGFGKDDFVVTDPLNQYWASKGAAKQISFTTTSGGLFRYDQYDAVLNRPDEIMEAMGLASPDEINQMKRAVQLRWEKLGVKRKVTDPVDLNLTTPETPEIDEPSAETTSNVLDLKFSLKDSYSPLTKWHMVVNGVPEDIPEVEIMQSAQEIGNVVNRSAQVKLNPGRNLIQVWSTNSKSIDSKKCEIEVTYKPKVKVKPVLYALVVGVYQYGPAATNLDGDRQLPGARADLERVTTFLRRFKPSSPKAFGNSPFSDAVVVPVDNGTRAQILDARERLFKKANPEDVVILYFAGHGIVDERSDSYFRFLPSNYDYEGASNDLHYLDIQKMVEGCGSRNLLILLDACQSGEIDVRESTSETRRSLYQYDTKTKVKLIGRGVGRAQGVSDELAIMRHNFVDLEISSGAAVICAASGAEKALEMDDSGGVFTTAVLEALGAMGGSTRKDVDLDGDGMVRVSELKEYVVRRVQQRHSGQIPTMRQENPDNDFNLFNFPTDKKPVPPATKKPIRKPTKKTRGG